VRSPSFALARSDFLDQLRHDLVDIADDPEVGPPTQLAEFTRMAT